jgi:long-chain acyl-CoA synthetase
MNESFRALTRASPGSAALIDGRSGRVSSRLDLLERSEVLALRMREAGISRGDLLALQLPNSVDFVATILAAEHEGIAVMPIDRDATRPEVAALLSHFSARAILSTAAGDAPEPAISMRHTPRPGLLPGTALLKLSSGSTGAPKAIMTSMRNLAADCAHICRSMRIAESDINLGVVPFSHSYGFSNLVTPLLLQGTAVVFSNDYLPQTIMELCNAHLCSVAPLIPMVYDHLTRAAAGRFATVHTFISAGAPLPAEVSRRFRDRFGTPIHTFYGCSECGGITYDRDGSAAERGSVGSALEGVALTVEEATGRLTVASDAVALGYLHCSGRQEALPAGRFTTDDTVEEGAGGEYAITGRLSDFINTAGKKVNPREVEEILLQLAGVRDAKVYGVPAGARGEVVAAAIVAGPEVTRDSVRAFCRERLSAHKVPRIVKLIESIPVDERGKVRRSALAGL